MDRAEYLLTLASKKYPDKVKITKRKQPVKKDPLPTLEERVSAIEEQLAKMQGKRVFK